MPETSVYYSQSRSEVAQFLPTRYEKVLEIGCGEGNFRSNLNENCEYWGVEPVRDVAARAEKRLSKVLNGTFDEVYDQLPDDYFDLIICNDVIEHIADTDDFLKNIKRKMKKDSYIVGSIPNVRELNNLIGVLFKKDWEYKEAGILDKTHLKFFTEKSLKKTFVSNGFTIENFFGINEISVRPTSPKQFAALFLIYLFGKDTKFPQFGFRIKNNSSAV